MRRNTLQAKGLFILCQSAVIIFLASCATGKKISRSAEQDVINNTALKSAHVGISLYDPATGKYIYNYQGDKYFVPASNTKIPTCYAAMKYLGDSLIAFRYAWNDSAVFIVPSGDPTLLHPDFKNQPGIRFLQSLSRKIYLTDANWKEKPLGYGWSWDDYNDNYMAERSPLPVYGNIAKWIQTREEDEQGSGEMVSSVFSEPAIPGEVIFSLENKDSSFFVQRNRDSNVYTVYEGKEKYKEQELPFITNGLTTALALLADTVGKVINNQLPFPKSLSAFSILHSQPTDSVLSPMMHRSDNFFAEQLLLMVSTERLGIMNDERVIDTILKSDFKDLPQKPQWVDGSGLSRYNLFSPQDMVFILDKMRSEFGMDRIKKIFPTGGEGTLASYYKNESGYIYAKTGTLSGVVAISGFLYTKKGKLLIFSVLVNNHQASATAVRRGIEKFLLGVR